MCWVQCERVTLFVNAYEVMDWVLGGAARPDEQEGRLEQWERGDSREWTILEDSAVSRKKLWKNIGCLLSAPTFGFGGSRLW